MADFTCRNVQWILNLECAVLPPGRIDAATLDDATAIAMNPWDLSVARIKR